jgi:tripartite ATP-independent transporter DctP family solute receptor
MVDIPATNVNKTNQREETMKRKFGMRLFGLAVLNLLIAVVLFSPVSAAPIVIKLGHYSTADLPFPGQGIAPNVIVFKNYVEQTSNGEMQVEIHPNAVLGSVRPMIELTQAGAIHMTVPYTSIMVPFVAEMGITQTPFLFKDHAAAYRTMQGPLGKDLNELWVKKTGTRILSWPEGSGFRQVYTKNKMVKTPDDMKGLKIRVPENPGLLALFSAFGAKTVTVTWTEVYTALQTGVADSCETELLSVEEAKLFEVMKYATMLNHSYNVQPLIVNEKFFQSLSPKNQMILMRAAELGSIAHNGFCRASENMVIEKAVKNGIKFYTPTEAEIDQFKQVGQKAYLDALRKSVSEEWIKKAFDAVAATEAEMAKEYQAKLKP